MWPLRIGVRYDKNPTPTWSWNNFLFAPGSPLGFEKNDRATFDQMTLLTGSNAKAFTAILGPKQQTWVGGSGRHRHAIWCVDVDGLPIWVLVSVQGSTYEIEHLGNPWDGSIVEDDMQKLKRFLLWLIDRLSEPA
jgi:hypothetical protein